MVKKMKIAISLLSGISYGSVTYFRNLLPALAKSDKKNEYHIFIQRSSPIQKMIKQDNFIFHTCNFNTNVTFFRHFWEQFILPFKLKKLHIDIMFTTKNGNILFAPCKTIICIRNMEPLCYRNYDNYWLLNIFSAMRELFTIISMRKADRIVAVSEFTKDYLKDHFPQFADKVDTVYIGNDLLKGSAPKRAIPAGHEKFLLTASKFVAYANQYSLIEGYAVLCKNNKDVPPLLIAGGVHDKLYFQKVKRLVEREGLAGKVNFLGLISHEELAKLYAKAEAFVFPSTLEACPQTLLEAMAYGLPIAASNVPPMPEICGKAVIYFEPFDKNDIAAKMKLLLFDQGLRGDLKKAAIERCRYFNLEKTTPEIIKVFEKVHNK